MRGGAEIRVLVAEDGGSHGAMLGQFLSARGCTVATCTDGRSALDTLQAEAFDVVLLDAAFLEGDGHEVVRQMRAEAGAPEVIVIAGTGAVQPAITAMELGAYDVLTRPYGLAEVDLLVRRASEKRRLVRENVLLQSHRASAGGAPPEIVTQYAPMRAVLALVERVARGDSAVCITGESGTGKMLLARALHGQSHRAASPLALLDCAAVPGDRLESELFGHERDVFPGAAERTLGLLELAAGGTIVLGEIDALPMRLQGKLLRALELGAFYRVGGTQKVYCDVRVVATSTRELAQRVEQGTFRGDLYYRINTISITLPPLRERVADIPVLARHFLARHGGKPPVLSDEAVDVMQAYPWPGNVRELRNVIERARLIAADGVVRSSDLPLTAPAMGDARGRADSPAAPLAPLDLVEQRHIAAVLGQVGWHQGRAAEILGISPKTLYRKIRQYGFRRPSGR